MDNLKQRFLDATTTIYGCVDKQRVEFRTSGGMDTRGRDITTNSGLKISYPSSNDSTMIEIGEERDSTHLVAGQMGLEITFQVNGKLKQVQVCHWSSRPIDLDDVPDAVLAIDVIEGVIMPDVENIRVDGLTFEDVTNGLVNELAEFRRRQGR